MIMMTTTTTATMIVMMMKTTIMSFVVEADYVHDEGEKENDDGRFGLDLDDFLHLLDQVIGDS